MVSFAKNTQKVLWGITNKNNTKSGSFTDERVPVLKLINCLYIKIFALKYNLFEDVVSL